MIIEPADHPAGTVVLIERRNNPRSDLSRLVYDAVRQATRQAVPA